MSQLLRFANCRLNTSLYSENLRGSTVRYFSKRNLIRRCCQLGQKRQRSTKTKTDVLRENGGKEDRKHQAVISKECVHHQLLEVLDMRFSQLIENSLYSASVTTQKDDSLLSQEDKAKTAHRKKMAARKKSVSLSSGAIELTYKDIFKGKSKSVDAKLGVQKAPKQLHSSRVTVAPDITAEKAVQDHRLTQWMSSLDNFKRQIDAVADLHKPLNVEQSNVKTNNIGSSLETSVDNEIDKTVTSSDTNKTRKEKSLGMKRQSDGNVSSVSKDKLSVNELKSSDKAAHVGAVLTETELENSNKESLGRSGDKLPDQADRADNNELFSGIPRAQKGEFITAFEEDKRTKLSTKALSENLLKHLPSDSKKKMPNIQPFERWQSTDDIKKATEKLKLSSSQALKKAAMANAIQKSIDRMQVNFNAEAKAYVDACIFNGMVNKAHLLLMAHHHNSNLPKKVGKLKSSTLRITDIEVYNSVLHALAKQLNTRKRDTLLSVIEESGLKKTLQTFAALLESEGCNRPIHKAAVAKTLADLKDSGFKIKDLRNCRYDWNEWPHVKEAVLTELPHFKFPTENPSVEYQFPLARKLKSVDTLGKVNPFAGVLHNEELCGRAARQIQLEVDCLIKVPSIISQGPVSEKTKHLREKLGKTKEEWAEMLKFSFERNVVMLQKKVNRAPHMMSILPYLKLFPSDLFVRFMMHEISGLALEAEKHSPPMSYLQKKLGEKLYEHYLMQNKIKNKYVEKLQSLYEEYVGAYNSDHQRSENMREIWQNLWHQDIDEENLNPREKVWPAHIVKSLGRFLYNLILYDTKIDANVMKDSESRHLIPAFYSIFRRTPMGISQEEIKPHPALVRLFKSAHVEDLEFEVVDMPSLVPPLPWHAQHGGNMMSTEPLVRLPDGNLSQYGVLEDIPNEQLHPIFDSLNAVSSCAWKINKPVLDVIIGIFRKNGNKDLDIPPPSSEGTPLPEILEGMTVKEKSAVYDERRKIKVEHAEMHSLWCTELYRLSIANKYRDDIFWFPHNMDFRGRYYPVPPHFNHLGSDIARSILVFAKGKPLGKDGLDWLKIHLVNLTGLKKRSANRERLQFANEMMSEILDSADHPLTGNRWWEKSDEPWQTLACCKEISNVVRSPDPTQYVSCFPVHQDGSCNGLQHYAALGRDKAGAQSVNLHPFDTPQDVYSDIVELVEEERRKDAEQGEEIARMLDGFVQRKVIKQTVMTTVYGVTKFGARLQINRQLEDMSDFPTDQAWMASWYLTEKTFLCLQKMFTSTKQIQDWFTMCANLVSGVSGKPVEWVTPLGLPVLQPYTRTGVIPQMKTAKYRSYEKPNNKKQMNGFPPNFIHSLDSTHMMLTALYCLMEGITFVSVHDCFWTHAADVPIMNRVTREQFVSLHSQPILEDLSAFMVEKFGYSESELAAGSALDMRIKNFMSFVLKRVPEKGSFELENVLDSTYFFS